MTTLITGGSKCGKSRLAERILSGFAGRKIYIATMKPYGDEERRIIARHILQRQGKGFETLECYTDIRDADVPEGSAVLLECVGNLLANEMFTEGGMTYPSEKIVSGLRELSRRTKMLVIVTNQVGSDGVRYEEGTAAYIAEMGKVNCGIAAFADNVIECVYGIPLPLKGELPC